MSESVSVVDTILLSLRAVATVVVIYLFGILLGGKFKKLNRQGLQVISSLTAVLFIPCFFIAR